MQRCLQLHEQYDPSHPWHPSHLIPLAPRSTNRSTATLNTTAIQATERNHGGRRMGRLRTQLALPRLVVPRPEVPRYIPYDDSDELDA